MQTKNCFSKLNVVIDFDMYFCWNSKIYNKIDWSTFNQPSVTNVHDGEWFSIRKDDDMTKSAR